MNRSRNRGPECRPLTPGRDPGQHIGALQVGVGQGDALEEADQQDAQIRPVVDDRRADAGLAGRPAVVELVVAVDAQQVGVDAAAGDVSPGRRGDLDVAVGQTAGEFLESAWLPGQGGQLLEQRVQFRVGEERHTLKD